MNFGSWRNETINTAGRGVLLFGLALMFTGLVVWLVPEILVAFIAACFFLAGGALAIFGWQLRRQNKHNIRIHIL
ncbi:MAG: hypothetical protein ACRBF0_00235 [Calditrichia bacterium]